MGKNEAQKDLSSFKNFTNLTSTETLRSDISSLNIQQRKLFDDIIERLVSTDFEENPFYLFIAGEAGTGKSHLVRTIIEAVKIIEMKAGAELQKPSLLIMAPTANASFLIGGKTVDSVLGFSPSDAARYTSAEPGKMTMMKYQYEDVKILFCDEISMVAAMKLAKKLQTSRIS